jgi:hypothetical protein
MKHNYYLNVNDDAGVLKFWFNESTAKKMHVGVEESIVNALYRLGITDQLFKSYFLQSGVFTMYSSTLTTRRNLKKHPIHFNNLEKLLKF